MQFAFTYTKLYNLFLTQVEVKHSMGKERNQCASNWLDFQQLAILKKNDNIILFLEVF